MVSKEQLQSALRSASIRGRAQAPEIAFHLQEAHKCLEQELFIASCLCSITFIDISMRYLDAVLGNTTQDDDGTLHTINELKAPELQGHRYMNREILKALRDKDVDITALAFEGEAELNHKLDSGKGKPEIRRIRDDLCHGNVAEHFEARSDCYVFHPELMRERAQQLYSAANAWLNVFQYHMRKAGHGRSKSG